MDRSKQLGEGSVAMLLLKFSFPAIIGMLVQALYNIVDRIFIGNNVGPLAIAGITITFPFFTILMAFGMLVGIGAGALVSIRLGQQRRDEAEQILGNAFVLGAGITFIVTIISLLFLDPLLRAFGASDSILPYAKDYIVIILLGAIIQNIGFGLNNVIRAEGSPKVAMFTMLLGAILNIVLDYILITVFQMGVQGAAIATVISQIASAMWVISFFTGKRSTLKLHPKHFRVSKEIMLGIFAIGMSPFSMQMAASIVTVISNNSLQAYGGDLAVGAMGIITSVAMLFLMPVFGINQGSQPIIGYNYGAQEYKRVKQALKLAILAGTLISAFGFIAIQFYPQFFIRIFNDDPQLVSIGANGIRIFLFMLPIIGFQVVSANYFQAVGKAPKAMFLSLSRQVIFLIPLLLILPLYFGLNGIWYSAPLADFLSALLTALLLYREIKHLDDKHEELLEAEGVV